MLYTEICPEDNILRFFVEIIDESVYRNLDIACESIKAFEQSPEIQSFSSLLLGTVELKKMDFETADLRNHCEISEADFSPCIPTLEDNMCESYTRERIYLPLYRPASKKRLLAIH